MCPLTGSYYCMCTSKQYLMRCVLFFQNVPNIVPYVLMRQSAMNAHMDISWQKLQNVSVSTDIKYMYICILNIHYYYLQVINFVPIVNQIFLITECPKHCSLCYNETECFECTQGYFITDNMECESELLEHLMFYFSHK